MGASFATGYATVRIRHLYPNHGRPIQESPRVIVDVHIHITVDNRRDPYVSLPDT